MPVFLGKGIFLETEFFLEKQHRGPDVLELAYLDMTARGRRGAARGRVKERGIVWVCVGEQDDGRVQQGTEG